MLGENISAWKTIKDNYTIGKRQESVGYQISLNNAIELYMSLRKFIKNVEREDEIFNTDKEVTEALINKNELKKIESVYK